jgi:plastocyanin
MRKIYFLIAIFLALNTQIFAKVWIINNSGETFTPADITINSGDSVKFVIESIHQVREVSQSTWQSNGTTALSGGFSTPSGGGLILPAQLGIGTHYYVCIPHASGGMKGTITVQNVTGIFNDNLNSGLLVFPNPAKNIVHIQIDKNSVKSRFLLSDLNGKQILYGKLNDEITALDIESLPTGVYILVIDDSPTQFRKIIKQ